jgi:excisionase family DNA binding protein
MTKIPIILYNTDPDLIERGFNDLTIRLDALEKKLTPTTSKWITRKEAAQILRVSLVTISDWSKKGVLKPYYIGSRVRFKLAEIEAILNSSRDEI